MYQKKKEYNGGNLKNLSTAYEKKLEKRNIIDRKEKISN